MKKICFLLLTLVYTLACNAQITSYQFAEKISENQSEVTFKVYVFCNTKKNIEQAACLAGIRCVMFDGIPDTKFKQSLLNEGEQSSIEKNTVYFNDLYNRRYTDYVKKCVMLSKFKKADIKKATLFEVTIKVFELRKNLEKNKIKTKFGI